MCQVDIIFKRWCGYKKGNKQVSPLELLILGELCYLGCGFTFDDIEYFSTDLFSLGD